jgi:phenylacetate-CoA ligase
MASLYTTLAAGLIFPLHERLKHHDTVAVRKHMEDAQWWSPERLEAFQLQRLRALLTNAQQHVPYYRELFAKLGCKAEDIRSLGDLKCLPFPDQTDHSPEPGTAQVRACARALARFNTGGSSGEPLIFLIGKERDQSRCGRQVAGHPLVGRRYR